MTRIPRRIVAPLVDTFACMIVAVAALVARSSVVGEFAVLEDAVDPYLHALAWLCGLGMPHPMELKHFGPALVWLYAPFMAGSIALALRAADRRLERRDAPVAFVIGLVSIIGLAALPRSGSPPAEGDLAAHRWIAQQVQADAGASRRWVETASPIGDPWYWGYPSAVFVDMVLAGVPLEDVGPDGALYLVISGGDPCGVIPSLDGALLIAREGERFRRAVCIVRLDDPASGRAWSRQVCAASPSHHPATRLEASNYLGILEPSFDVARVRQWFDPCFYDVHP